MNLTLNQAVDHFLTDMTLEGKSPETIIWHRKKLNQFCKFMTNEEGPARVCDLSVDDARDFIKSLMDQKTRYGAHVLRKEVEGGLAQTTIHGFVRSLRTFGSWLFRESYTEEHVFQGLKPPKLPQTLIEPLSEDEIRRLLLVIPQNTPEGMRSQAIMLTFLDTGVRLSELINLKISNIDFKTGQFKVFGKGSKERIVPMGLSTRRALMRYKDSFRPEPINPNEDRLFLNMSGTPISKDSVEKLVQRIKAKALIPRLHPHLLRHTFAVRYLVNGGDVFTLQKILGHASLEMTRRYVTLACTDVKEKHRQFSPIDNLGGVERKRGRPRRIV